MDQVDTTPSTLPGPPAQGAEPGAPEIETTDEPPRRLWPVVLLAVLAVVAGATGVAGGLVNSGRVGIRPGSLNATEPFLTIEGIDFYPSEGEILYTTVNIDRLSYAEWLWARYVEDDTEILDEDLIFQGRTADDKREDDLQLMQVSKSTATLVALTVLGYDVFDDNGAAVVEVADDAPAAGLLERGDVVEGIDDTPVANAGDLVEVLTGTEAGTEVQLQVERDGAVIEVPVVLGVHPEREGGYLGVSVETRIIEAPLPFDVEIGSGNVGGPSAGMAFTLALLDGLTEGELTGGGRIAATGTIDLAGCVGPIGGLPQKVVAARENGAELFLVPESQLDEISDVSGIEVVGVRGLDDALAALADHGGDVSVIPDFETTCP